MDSDSSKVDAIDRFCRQYLQLEREVDFPDGLLLCREDVQAALFERLFADGALKHPPPSRYQLQILKPLISKIESSIDDWNEHVRFAGHPSSRCVPCEGVFVWPASQGVSDNLMNIFAELIATSLPSEADAAQRKAYVTYSLSLLDDGEGTPEIAILENPNLLAAGGTTGLRTWEAALHLGQYLCASPNLVQGASVLELGAGTGYVSIMCAKFLGAKHVIASDGSYDVVANLPENFYLNELDNSDILSVLELKWGHALLGTEEEEWIGGRNLDLVLGADVTYDKRVVPTLVSTLADLFDLYPAVQILISATERNRDTFDAFLRVCEKRRFDVTEVEFQVPPRAEQRGPFYNDNVPIRICKIIRPRWGAHTHRERTRNPVYDTAVAADKIPTHTCSTLNITPAA
jgi:protein-lysine N-methyltransferase EEF2KMT